MSSGLAGGLGFAMISWVIAIREIILCRIVGQERIGGDFDD